MNTIQQFTKWLGNVIAELQLLDPTELTLADYDQCRRAAGHAERAARLLGGQHLVPTLQAAHGLSRTLDALGACLAWAMQQEIRTESPGAQSPYFNTEQAAAYLQITVTQLRTAVEHGRLKPLRGPRNTYRFTKDQLDKYLCA